MTASSSTLRPLLIALVGVALLSQSGCVWLRAKFANTAVYEDSDQANPLEVPPDLDAPNTAGAMVIPDVNANPMTTGAPAAAAAVATDGFVLGDTVDSTFRRVGIALAKIDTVVMGDSTSAANTHAITFQGQPMLIRVEAAGNGARVFAVSADGTPLTGGAAATLLSTLRTRLG